MIRKYQNHLEANGMSDNTVVAYINDINQMMEIINTNAKDIKIGDLDDWLYVIKDLSPKSKNRKITAVKGFFNYLFTREYIVSNPSIHLKNMKTKDNPQSYVSREDFKTMLWGCKNARDRAILTFMFNTGVRVSELISLQLKDFGSVMEVTGKGNKTRKIYLNQETIESVSEYIKVRKDSEYGNLFISNSRKPMSDVSLNKTIKTICARVGIEQKFSNHSFRRGASTDKMKKGIPIKAIAELLGHSDVSTTARHYQFLDDEDMKLYFC